jgi:hypothetical protein
MATGKLSKRKTSSPRPHKYGMRSFVPPSCHLPCRRLPLGLLALSITVTYNSSPMAHDPCLGTFTFQWHFPHFSGAVPMWLPIRHHPPCHKHQYQRELFHLPPSIFFCITSFLLPFPSFSLFHSGNISSLPLNTKFNEKHRFTLIYYYQLVFVCHVLNFCFSVTRWTTILIPLAIFAIALLALIPYTNFNTERDMRWRLILEEFGPDLRYVKESSASEALQRLITFVVKQNYGRIAVSP